jgi:hypothetical protein
MDAFHLDDSGVAFQRMNVNGDFAPGVVPAIRAVETEGINARVTPGLRRDGAPAAVRRTVGTIHGGVAAAGPRRDK